MGFTYQSGRTECHPCAVYRPETLVQGVLQKCQRSGFPYPWSACIFQDQTKAVDQSGYRNSNLSGLEPYSQRNADDRGIRDFFKRSQSVSCPQRSYADEYIIFPENIGSKLPIDETCLSHGELYTIVTYKAAKGKKGAIVAIVAGTKAEKVIGVLCKIPQNKRNRVHEVTLDMSGSMDLIVRRSFPLATRVTDRFHVQKLTVDTLQEMRIKYRWLALDEENVAIKKAKERDSPSTLSYWRTGTV